ncbi:uncharacterized protein LOC113364185 [Ctenocephalides felis]|uniref:uncharacterized protein LOC113364185 n=1 Tax=Ctenocephalides felis TaxID=7515 RepID=UPI000E6E5568|nr:uncharacterized protein LOC113364185 [Ctenocephalides felis]
MPKDGSLGFEDFLRIRSCNPLRKYAKNVIGTVNPQIVVILENVPEIRKFHLRNFEVGVEIRKGQGRRKGINRSTMQKYFILSLLLASAFADYQPSSQPDSGSAVDQALAAQQEQQNAIMAAAMPPPPPYYASYGPQDPVQQYVANYGPANIPVGYGNYGPDQGYAVQTGIEGFLVPASYTPPPTTTSSYPLRLFSSFPRVLADAISRVGVYLLGGAGFLLLGGAFAALVCTFTPFCTISFLGLGLAKESVRSFMTPDKLTAATIFLKEAIDKYQSLQKRNVENSTNKRR